jgi:hypothetical protein
MSEGSLPENPAEGQGSRQEIQAVLAPDAEKILALAHEMMCISGGFVCEMIYRALAEYVESTENPTLSGAKELLLRIQSGCLETESNFQEIFLEAVSPKLREAVKDPSVDPAWLTIRVVLRRLAISFGVDLEKSEVLKTYQNLNRNCGKMIAHIDKAISKR